MTNLNMLINDKRLENIKYLAGEMVREVIEKGKDPDDQLNDETIFYDIDIQSAKHKSQVFYDKPHRKLLRNFSLNRISDDNSKIIKGVIRRKNKQITAQNRIDYLKNKISFHLSIKGINNSNINGIESSMNNEEQKQDEIKENKNIDLILEEDNISEGNNENLDEEDFTTSNNLLIYGIDELDNERSAKDNYEIIYLDPTKISTHEREELSTKNEEKNIINKSKQINKEEQMNKGKYLFEKGIKMLNMKNTKIKKAQEIMENKNKGFFDVKNFVTKKKKKSPKKRKVKFSSEKYIPLQNKASELYRYHLTQIEINQRNKILKEKKKEDEEINLGKKNEKKLKKNFNSKSWNNFLQKEKEWKKNNISNREELFKNKYNDKKILYDRPKINKNSIIILGQKKEKNKYNFNFNINNNVNIFNKRYNKADDIHTKLFEDKERYDNKLKFRIQSSMPTFSPHLNRNNKIKFIKNLTDKNISRNNKNKSKISFDNKNNIYNLKRKNMTLNDNCFTPKLISSIKTKQVKKTQINNKKNNYNDIKTNNDNKKMLVYELNIDNPNYNNKNNKNKKQKISKTNSYSFIEKLGENACKIFNSKNKINKNQDLNNKTENNKEISNNKIISSSNYSNNLTKNTNESRNTKRKSTRKKTKKDLEINSNGNFLYDLNIRDNTSNSLNQFVVLSSKKYMDFFK